MSDLLPCPFCGGEPKTSITRCVGGPLIAAYCPACSVLHRTEAEAIAAWNRRASPLPLPEPGEGNAAVADSGATREPISRAATIPLQVDEES